MKNLTLCRSILYRLHYICWTFAIVIILPESKKGQILQRRALIMYFQTKTINCWNYLLFWAKWHVFISGGIPIQRTIVVALRGYDSSEVAKISARVSTKDWRKQKLEFGETVNKFPLNITQQQQKFMQNRRKKRQMLFLSFPPFYTSIRTNSVEKQNVVNGLLLINAL